MSAVVEWLDDETFRIAGIEYGCRPFGRRFASTPGHFCLLKPRWEVELYEHLLRDVQPRNMLEVGIYEGASAALFAEIAAPRKIVAIDLKRERSEALDDFIARRDLGDVVVPHYGVDQSEANRLRAIVADEFAGEPLDLVIDDASHFLEETRITFDALFPLVRPGGSYVIEDWSWAHKPLPVWPERPPLTVLVFELVLAAAYQPTVIADVSVNRNWVRVVRGDADLDPREFSVSKCYEERGRSLVHFL